MVFLHMPKELNGVSDLSAQVLNHIGSQRGRVPTHVHVGRLDNEGGVGGAGPNRMKM